MSDNNTSGYFDHSKQFCVQFKDLYNDEDITKDVCFKCRSKEFWCHRVILAARSKYFKALLYGHMKESEPNSVIEVDIDPSVFCVLLEYLYSSTISLANFSLEFILKLLKLAHHYQLTLLKDDICNYLKMLISSENALEICQMATFYELNDLQRHSLSVIDSYPKKSLINIGNVSHYTLLAIVSRDSFPLQELDVFDLVQSWIGRQKKPSTHEHVRQALNKVRISLIPPKNLFLKVQPSKLFSNDQILSALRDQTLLSNIDLPHRGIRKLNVNLLDSNIISIITSGNSLAAAHNTSLDGDQPYCSHPIGEREGIKLKFSYPHIINRISFLLPTTMNQLYSYKVMLSVNGSCYKTVMDYSEYHCHGWQHLFLPEPCAVGYIRIVGTWCSINCYFSIDEIRVSLDPSATFVNINEKGVLEPKNNVATIDRGALVIEGVSRKRSTLLNGNTVDYNWEEGYTCHQVSGDISPLLRRFLWCKPLNIRLSSRIVFYDFFA